jgi:CHRD domain
VKKLIAISVAAAGALALLATFAQAGPTSTSAKTTICHRTKSAKHPYRQITVSGTALAAHQRHGSDIIPAPPGGCPSSVMTARHGGRPLSATMTGAAEVPGPADPDGTGTATIRLTPGLGRVCFILNVANITLPAAAAHIHIAPPTAPGPIVVPLVAPDATGSSQGCVSTTRALVKSILKHPSDYYVNVHTTDFPAGAIRGQLGKGH